MIQGVRWLGFFLAGIALMFIVRSFWVQRAFLRSLDIPQVILTVIVGSILYVLANLILVLAWKMLLHWFGEHRLSLSASVFTYGQSQILKYIPGNLLSLPSRHVLGRQQGAEHGPLLGAATFEIAGLLVVASIISIAGIAFYGDRPLEVSLWSALSFLLLAVVGSLALRYMLSRQRIVKWFPVFETLQWGSYSHLLRIWSLYLVFFIISGLLLLWTIRAIQGSWSTVPFTVLVSAFSSAWLLGLITPGAPAGVGVREGILVLILSPYVDDSTGLVVVVLMRLITTLGDLLFYVCSLSVRRPIFVQSQTNQSGSNNMNPGDMSTIDHL